MDLEPITILFYSLFGDMNSPMMFMSTPVVVCEPGFTLAMYIGYIFHANEVEEKRIVDLSYVFVYLV